MDRRMQQSQSYVPFVYPRQMVSMPFGDVRSQEISDGRISRNVLPIEHPRRFQDTSFTNSKRDSQFKETSYIYDGRINRNKVLPTEYSGQLNDTKYANGNKDARFEEMPYASDGRISRNKILAIEHHKRLHDTSFANRNRDARFEEMSYISDERISRSQVVPIEYQERFSDTSFAYGKRDARFEEMSYISDGRKSRSQVVPLEHSRSYEEPPSQTISRSATEDVPNKKRQMVWIIITRISAALLIILDCVSDWLQYSDMHKENIEHDTTDIFEHECQNAKDIVKKYMYFTIAGTVLAVIQLANIIFQIYCEVRLNKKVTEKDEKKVKYPMKLLDGRTETFYSLLFIEIPQALLVAGHQKVCLPTCSPPKMKSKKHLEKTIKIILNGGAALLNNAWRSLTCESFCEETTEEKKDGKCCKGECCSSFARTMFKCCCPCCCCFHRYECTIPFCICGKTLVCDACKFTADPWFCEIPFGCCTLFYCPLNEKDNPKSGQKLFKVESECCKSFDNSYEPFIFHTVLAKIVGILYLLVYVVNLFKLFCEDNFIINILAYVPDWLYPLL